MEYKSFMEALKGNQHKLDKNKNGKLDAHDFKLLRKEETEELDEAMSPQQKADFDRMMAGAMSRAAYNAKWKKPLKSDSKVIYGKNVKEEAELSEEHIVHVDDGSKYGDQPHKKDADHVMAGVKKHNGKFDGHSDKGAYFKFNSKSDAEGFVRHVKAAPHKTVYADLHEEIEGLDEADVQARADYKLDKSGRKYHKQIHFKDGSNDEANEKNEVREETDMNEEMTDAQKAERERIVKGMKKNLAGFKAKYGERAKEVMYATATKQAMKEEAESLEEESGQHKVVVTVSDPNHPAVSQRKEQIMKRVIVKADHKDGAIAKAKEFYKKKGYKVHDAEYHSPQPKSTMKTEETNLEEEQLDERNKENATRRKMMDASRGARWKVQNKVSADDVRDWDGKHKTAQAQNKAIGRALRNEEVDILDEAVESGNKGYGYHGQHESDVADKKYSAMHAKVKKVAGEAGHLRDAKKPNVMVKHYLDSRHGRHLAGNEHDHEYIKKDFGKFKKSYKESDFAKESVGFDEEGNLMAEKLTYAQFMEQLLEYTPGPGGVTRVQGRSYGAQYHDPEGDDDADDKPKKKAEPAVKRGRGRPAGSKSGANQKVTSGKSYGGIATHSLHLPSSNR